MAAHCRYCGRRILWVETHKGNRMPLDPEPSAVGNVILEQAACSEGQLGLRRAYVLRRRDYWAGDRYTPHFTTCPGAERFRRGKW